MLFKQYGLNRPGVLWILILSAIGHFIGGLYYYWFATHSGADSVFYFKNATTTFTGFGYKFAFFILGYLKLLFLGESFLGAFLFSAALGLLASSFYLITYKILLNKLSDGEEYFLYDANILLLPAFLLMCWPSYFFWSAGLIKDNFAFLSIGMFLFFFAEAKISIFKLSLLLTASILGFLVRPYLFIIMTVSAIVFSLFCSKWNMFAKIGILLLISYLAIQVMPYLSDFSSMISFSGGSLRAIESYAIRTQSLMNIGSSLPLPTHNPELMFFFLPYLIAINLLLPLFFGIRNLIGILSSFENLYLVFWLSFVISNWMVFTLVRKKLQFIQFLMCYFIIGMSFLSMMNTNLGIAMREKMMYVPSLLITIMLVYAYKKILALQHYFPVDEEIPVT